MYRHTVHLLQKRVSGKAGFYGAAISKRREQIGKSALTEPSSVHKT